jgi:ribokinase
VPVHVFGNACRDITYRVPALPRPGETIIADRVTSDIGGKGLNQAIAAQRTGALTSFCGPVGEDEIGRQVKDMLLTEGIPLNSLVVKPLPSDVSHIFVGRDGENAIVTVAVCASQMRPEECEEALARMASGDIVLLQGNLSAHLSIAIMRHARNRSCRVVLNPAPLPTDPEELLGLADILVMNQLEAEAVTGAQSAVRAAERLQAVVAIITAGAEGAYLRNNAAPVIQISTSPLKACDTVGAGDVLVGSFAGALALGLSVSAALQAAVALASDKVTREGVISAFPTAAKAQAEIRRFRGVSSS